MHHTSRHSERAYTHIPHFPVYKLSRKTLEIFNVRLINKTAMREKWGIIVNFMRARNQIYRCELYSGKYGNNAHAKLNVCIIIMLLYNIH